MDECKSLDYTGNFSMGLRPPSMTFMTAVHSGNVLCFSHPFFTIIEFKALKPSKLQSLLDHLFVVSWFDSCILISPLRGKVGTNRKNWIFRRLNLCSRPIFVSLLPIAGFTAAFTAHRHRRRDPGTLSRAFYLDLLVRRSAIFRQIFITDVTGRDWTDQH